MKAKKIFVAIISIITVALMVATFMLCGAGGGKTANTQGIEYTPNSHGAYTVKSIGDCTDSKINIDTYNGKAVTRIGIEAFKYCSTITDVTIGDSVTSIGAGAFMGCSSLKTITISPKVTKIEPFAFYKCQNLTIKCKVGSTAHIYALENGINFEKI